ncbi:hypothetical protein IQ249_17960 [Lusitaniella coriacea LEGE 07157]|uniref:Uncharacterized protein n=1 Tax=Lusitaniella coriacea LEGE 07157 TaxID=945747 RepID=A0A8J7DYC5_9CYAN|nr:hypothetical protein [Lusitaniella coriacea]MBE9117787.1 hypothetical protein [Lusitaniella coriacea LEGE 07157]
MSSAVSDTPYKSRLFNFVNRQVLQVRDRAGNVLRNLQVATLWGLQILAYPAYLLLQTGRLLGQRAGQTLGKLGDARSDEDATLRLPTADAPIQRILETVEPWLLQMPQFSAFQRQSGLISAFLSRNSAAIVPKETNTEKDILPSPPTIQSIASALENRHLVLVSADNQIFDLLSPQQQQTLNKQIIWEVANLKRRQKQLHETARRLTIPSYGQEETRVLAPIRFFWQAMRWVQCSPVAIAIDLFRESTLVPQSSTTTLRVLSFEEFCTQFQPALSPEALMRIDGKVAEWETQVSGVELVRRFNGSMGGMTRTLRDRLSNTTTARDISNSSATADPFALQSLIRAAISHFFGDRRTASSVSGDTTASALSDIDRAPESLILEGQAVKGLPIIVDEEENIPRLDPSPNFPQQEDPWLSWKDLFDGWATDEEEEELETIEAELTPPQLPSAPATPPLKTVLQEQNKPHSSIGNARSRKKPTEKSEASSRSSIRLKPISTKSNRPIPSSHRKTKRNQANRQLASRRKESLESVSEWIDTEATPVGYVKHPLEQILEWLDRIMLWVEELILAAWRWIYRRIP